MQPKKGKSIIVSHLAHHDDDDDEEEDYDEEDEGKKEGSCTVKNHRRMSPTRP